MNAIYGNFDPDLGATEGARPDDRHYDGDEERAPKYWHYVLQGAIPFLFYVGEGYQITEEDFAEILAGPFSKLEDAEKACAEARKEQAEAIYDGADDPRADPDFYADSGDERFDMYYVLHDGDMAVRVSSTRLEKIVAEQSAEFALLLIVGGPYTDECEAGDLVGNFNTELPFEEHWLEVGYYADFH